MEENTTVKTEPAAQDMTGNPPVEEAAKQAGTDKKASGVEENKPEAKTYDQAYIDQLLAGQKAAQDAAVAEALKVAGMDEESKAAYKKQQEEKRLADREADIALRELKADAREMLSQKDIPAEFMDMLVGKDLKETTENAEKFKKQFDAAVQAQVEKRLAGKTPIGGNGGGTPSEADAIAAEISKYMD